MRKHRDGFLTRAAHTWLRHRGFHVWKWPARTPNERNSIRVLAGRCSMDSPANSNGVRINAQQDRGWLRIQVEADESVIGWALSFNGRDIPITAPAEPPERHECQRCGSTEWTDVDYSGCSDCREPAEPPERPETP